MTRESIMARFRKTLRARRGKKKSRRCRRQQHDVHQRFANDNGRLGGTTLEKAKSKATHALILRYRREADNNLARLELAGREIESRIRENDELRERISGLQGEVIRLQQHNDAFEADNYRLAEENASLMSQTGILPGHTSAQQTAHQTTHLQRGAPM